jgi:N-acetylglucosaminyl-diphospho-decaprenol L-rhamnosyltransferase
MDAVVVSHNNGPDIGALLTCEPVREAFDRIVVVDNSSSDETPELAGELGAVVLRRNNRGFAAAVNVGAAATHGTIFALLNPDVAFTSADVARSLARHLESPAVGMAAPALELPSGVLQDSAREVPSPVDLYRRRFRHQRPDQVSSERPVAVAWVVAACLVISREAFEAVRGFDERYFLYFEDVDFAVRLRRAGYAVVYDPTVRVQHAHAAASNGSVASWATRQHLRSAATFYSRHTGYLFPRRMRVP